MDLSGIKDQVSNLTLYDLKAGVRKVQNGELFSVFPWQRVYFGVWFGLVLLTM